MNLAALFALTGCGDSTASSTYSVTFDSLTVDPGVESTQCVLKRLPHTRAMHVNQIENTLGTGTHHVIIYKTSDVVEQPTPFTCKPFAELLHPEAGVPLMISQKHDDTLTLPAGVGIAIDSGQMIRIEMHYINASPAPVQVSATSTFTEMKADDLKNEAGFAFFANTAIDDYYPSKGFSTCAHTDKIAGGYDFCCPGDPICGMLP